MSRLSKEFWAKPFAHRGLHDASRPENSLSAIIAAAEQGYAIELDVQPSSDGEAMVFHDYTLDRMTNAVGRTDALSTAELSQIKLKDVDEMIPTLEAVLEHISGRAPILIEIKDQSEAFTRTNGTLERRVCDLVRAAGKIETCAIMSFNPFSADHVRQHLPQIARGVVSYDYEHPHDAGVDPAYRKDLAELKWFEETEADFVSYGALSLPTERTQMLRERGVPVFCWTIRSAKQAEAALKHCDQITFEGYTP